MMGFLVLSWLCTGFGQNKVTGESVVASKTEELKASTKKRKTSKRLKESDGEKCINSFSEHIESSLIGRSLADLQKVPEGDESQNKLENRENFLSQTRGGETMVMAAAEPLDMHGTKVESSQQVIEKNMDIESTEGKTKKKSKKSRRSTVENLPSVEMKDPNSDGNDPLVTSATVNETTTKQMSHRGPVKGIDLDPKKIANVAVDPECTLSNSVNSSLLQLHHVHLKEIAEANLLN